MDLKPGTRKRQRAMKRGQTAEYLAALYLMLKGYRILSIRYKTPIGEIDIIAKRGNLIAFVEVKSRGDTQLAVDAVSPHSQRRIEAASRIWQARQVNGALFSFRYDIIAMGPMRWPSHLVDAF
jgi:putative endonuclease